MPGVSLKALREYDTQKAALAGQNTANEIMQNQALLNSLGIQTPQTQGQNPNVAIPQGNAQNMPPSILNQNQGISEQNLNMPTNQMPEGANVSDINANSTTPVQTDNSNTTATDNYTYIPSSEGYKEPNTLTPEQSAKVAQAMQMADATEAEVRKCL